MTRVAALEKENVDLKNQLKAENLIKLLPPPVAKPSYSELLKSIEVTSALRSSVVRESTERSRIERNIVIRGIDPIGSDKSEEINNDETMVDKVLSALGTSRDEVKRQYRVRPVKRVPASAQGATSQQIQQQQQSSTGSNNNGFIIVEFKELCVKTAACKSASALRKDNTLMGIYVNEDRTEAERSVDRELRAERNSRNNELAKMDGDGRRYGETEVSGVTRRYYYGGKVVRVLARDD
jgi:hypothetical protein